MREAIDKGRNVDAGDEPAVLGPDLDRRFVAAHELPAVPGHVVVDSHLENKGGGFNIPKPHPKNRQVPG